MIQRQIHPIIPPGASDQTVFLNNIESPINTATTIPAKNTDALDGGAKNEIIQMKAVMFIKCRRGFHSGIWPRKMKPSPIR